MLRGKLLAHFNPVRTFGGPELPRALLSQASQSQDQILTPPRPGPAPDRSSGRGSRLSPVQMLGGAGKGAPPRGRCGQERRQEQLSARSSCWPGHPEAARAGGRAGGRPRGAGSGRRALRPDTAHPASRLLSSASPRGATGAEAGGCPRPERAPARSGPRTGRGSCRPRTCPVHTSDAPSRPQPLQGSPECVHAAGSGRHGGDATVGARPRRLGELQRAPGAGWPRAGETHRATGYLRSGTGVSQNPSQSSASTTQDGRHVATHIT